MNSKWIGLVAGAAIFSATAAAASDPASTCEAAKLKASAKYASCRLSVWSKAVKVGASPDFSKCSLARFSLAEEKAMGACPTIGDDTTISARIDASSDDVATLLSGGAVEPNYTSTGQIQSWGPGDDGDLQTGASPDFVENGDGTVTDRTTQLMWEIKNDDDGDPVRCETETGDCADPHRLGNSYTWSTFAGLDYIQFTGSLESIFLEQLNNRCDQDPTVPCNADADCTIPLDRCGFAGHRDWRLPTIRELLTLVHYGPPPASFLESSPSGYWSSTTYAYSPYSVWYVDFYDGRADLQTKSIDLYARAVRGGS